MGLALGWFYEREAGHVSRAPAIHGLAANLAVGIAPLLERQASRRQLIFGRAMGAFEHCHLSTVRLATTIRDYEAALSRIALSRS